MSCPVSNHQTIENHGATESEMMGGSGPVPTQHAQILHLTDYINDLKRMRMELLGRQMGQSGELYSQEPYIQGIS